MDIVLDIRHNYDLDLQDISELLNFRIAMVPKSWTDQYGDTIRKNGQEIADCLNQMLSNNARVSSFFYWRPLPAFYDTLFRLTDN